MRKIITPLLIVLLTIVVIIYIFAIRGDEPVASKNTSVNLVGTSFEKLDLPKDYDIRQFEGMTLRFIVENNRHATILLNKSQEFFELTGINIKIVAVDFDTLVQKINLDFISKAGQYQIVYVDPYQTLNRFYDSIEVLNTYQDNPDMPHIIGLPEDFSDFQMKTLSYFEDENNIYTIPFDSTTMILFYRKDIFEKYRAQFKKERGYDWTPGLPGFTWERYIEIARWIDENVDDSEVKYGCGAMAQEHNSIFCEFSNVLASYGGDYFTDENVGTLGIKTFENINVTDDIFVKALDVYKQIIDAAAPESVDWNWTDAANAFREGQIAMMLNWDENYPYLEDPEYSKVYGKVGCAILPRGSVKNANIFGGSGIGINKYASEEEKEAAWLFIVWATSKEMQREILLNPEGGNLPSRMSVYNEPDIKKELEDPFSTGELLNKELVSTVLKAWEPQNQYLRPKVSNFYYIERVLNENLHNFVTMNLDSREVSQRIFQELVDIRNKGVGGAS
jgi:multiple sugar transport system substrate-binding protein